MKIWILLPGLGKNGKPGGGDKVGHGTIKKVRTRDVYMHWHMMDGKSVDATTWSVPKSDLVKRKNAESV